MSFKRIRKIQDALQFEINPLNESELRKLIGECQRLTKTNCSWIMYGLKGIVIQLAKSQLRWLKIQKEKAKAKTEG